jgi:SET domain
VQVGIDRHIMLQPEHLQYINHSCDPNVFFDTYTMQVIALRPIDEGNEMTFFYPSTEWDMAQPFTCYCGSHRCLGEIKGAAHINGEVISQYRLTRFIQQQLHDRSNKEKRA